jgi:hypothetical protein
MKTGDLVKVKANYFVPGWNLHGIIIRELDREKIGPFLNIRAFDVFFQEDVKKMYEYEMDVINAD